MQSSVHVTVSLPVRGGGEGEISRGGGGGKGEGGGLRAGPPQREPQSLQSVPRSHIEYSAPLPPSSQSPSEVYRQSSTQVQALGERGGSGGGDGRGGGCGGAIVQASYRGRAGRLELDERRRAATAVQAAQRGNLARRGAKGASYPAWMDEHAVD